jgi:glycopeptide antibiotics resistance protein
MTAPRRSYVPQPPAPLRLSHRNFAVLAVLYGLMVVYSSLLLGPDGLHYVPISAAEAWQKFRAVGFIANGSDQRADWIANMMMVIPLAYFVNGAFPLRGRISRNLINGALAAVISILFVLAVKYAQLFFPPRTVTLNYIVAQSIGVVLGIFLFHFARRHVYRRLLETYRRGDGLVIVLGGYSILLLAYFLMPFDLALSPDDLLNRLESMPIGIVPGVGHDPAYRTLLVLADMAATVPAGMFLAVTGRDMPFRAQLTRGIAVILPVTVLSLFILSITPYPIFLVSRTAGVALGVWFMESLKGKDLWKRHYRYAQHVSVAFPAYLVLLALAGGLLTDRWLNIDEALRNLEPDQLLYGHQGRGGAQRRDDPGHVRAGRHDDLASARFLVAGRGPVGFRGLLSVAGDRISAADQAWPDIRLHRALYCRGGRGDRLPRHARLVETFRGRSDPVGQARQLCHRPGARRPGDTAPATAPRRGALGAAALTGGGRRSSAIGPGNAG